MATEPFQPTLPLGSPTSNSKADVREWEEDVLDAKLAMFKRLKAEQQQQSKSPPDSSAIPSEPKSSTAS